VQYLKKYISTVSIILILILFISIISSCKQKSLTITSSKLSNSDSLIFVEMQDSLKSNYQNKDNNQLIKLSNKIISNFPNNSTDIEIKIAYLHYFKENYYLARYYFRKASEEFKSKGMQTEYAEQLSNIGVVMEKSGMYPKALDNYLQALTIFEKLKIKIKIARVSSNIGIIYQQLNEDNKSIKYYKIAMNIAEKENNLIVAANCYNNIATYFEEFKQNYDSALFYYNKAKNIYIKTSKSNKLLIIENNIGNNYLLKKEFNIADSIFKSVLQKSIDYGFESRITPILNNQAQSYILQKKYAKALSKVNQSLALDKNIQNKELELESLILLSEIYKKQNNYEKYSEILTQQYDIKEDISGIEQKKQINTLNIKYEVDKKESQIQILKLNNDIKNREILQLWLLIIIVILISIGGFIVFYLQRKNNKLINAQMRRDIADYINKINRIETQNISKEKEITKNRETQITKRTNEFDITDRENDVLLLIAKGYKNAKIAETLFISVNTVKYHTKNIFIKLDVKNRIEAVSKANGL